jgi:serine-type D-Ala-D-Ala carboxypeptidase/endopeptidase
MQPVNKKQAPTRKKLKYFMTLFFYSKTTVFYRTVGAIPNFITFDSMRGIFYLFFVGSTLIQGLLLGQESNKIRKEIEKILKYDVQIDASKTPSFIIGIIDGDKTYIEEFGKATLGEAFTPFSIVELGNVSKALSFLLSDDLYAKGIITLGTIVNDLVNDTLKNNRLYSLKLEDLLTLPNTFPNKIAPPRFQPIDQPFFGLDQKYMLDYFCRYKPESVLNNSLSHTDYAYWQVFLEKLLDSDFQSILDQYLNQLLGSGVYYTRFEEKSEGISNGIDRKGGVGKPYELDGYGAGNGLKASLLDLMKFVKYRLDNFQSKENFTMKLKNLPSAWSSKVKSYQGMYVVSPTKGRSVITTNGSSNIHSTFMAYEPFTKTGVIVVANGATGTNDLGMLILRMINDNWKRK